MPGDRVRARGDRGSWAVSNGFVGKEEVARLENVKVSNGGSEGRGSGGGDE